MTTFLAIAENFRLEFKEFNCNAVGVLEQVEGKYLMTEVILNPTLVITKEEDKEKALRVLDKSEKACLISNSINSKVSLNPTVTV
jgi:organic hydroperoxide reductase OsmC/OhrA